MKKIKNLIVCMGLVLGMTGCFQKKVDLNELQPATIENSVSLKGVQTNFSVYRWVTEPYADVLAIPQSEAIRLVEEKGSGIIYFGKTDCVWCQRAVPELNKVAEKMGVTIYYVDSSGNIPQEDYLAITDCFSEILKKNENGEPQFFTPFVVGVKEGKFVDWQESLVKGFKITSDTSQMNDAQKQELQQEYIDIINAVAKEKKGL